MIRLFKDTKDIPRKALPFCSWNADVLTGQNVHAAAYHTRHYFARKTIAELMFPLNRKQIVVNFKQVGAL